MAELSRRIFLRGLGGAALGCMLGDFRAAEAQSPQSMSFDMVFSKMRLASKAMQAYYREHGNMPSATNELDAALLLVYPPEEYGNQNPIVSDGIYRVLADVRIALDPTIANSDPDLWRSSPPERFNFMPAFSTIVLSDGQKTYCIWGSSVSGNPILDSNNRAIIIYKCMEQKEH